MTRAEQHRYDEHNACPCACKGKPYTLQEWEREVDRLRAALSDALKRSSKAHTHGVCSPARFDQGDVETADPRATISALVGTHFDESYERLLQELERAEEFLHDTGCGDGAIAVHEAIRRLER